MNIVPLQNRVVIRKHPNETVSTGGIVLAASAQEQSHKGTIVSVGPGKTLKNGNVVPMSVNVGDIVVYISYAGSETLKQDDQQYIIVSEDDILAVLD